MTTSMSPSITKGQAVKFTDLQIDALRKSGLPKKETQEVLEENGDVLANEFLKLVRERVERKLEMIVRRVKVDRSLTPEQVIDETGRVKWYINEEALAKMPRGEGEEVDVYFFPAKRFMPVKEYEAELAKYGLVPDPRAQAAVNRDDLAFADTHPNGVQWDGNAYATFCRNDERRVHVSRNDVDWYDSIWFGGVRKIVATK